MLQITIDSIIAFHKSATLNKSKHKVAIKLLKEVMVALKYEAPCMMLDSKLIAVC